MNIYLGSPDQTIEVYWMRKTRDERVGDTSSSRLFYSISRAFSMLVALILPRRLYG